MTTTKPALDRAFSTTFDTPDGSFTVIGTAHQVLASGWTQSPESLVALIHPTIRPELDSITATAPEELVEGSALLQAHQAARAYYAGDAGLLAAVPVLQKSGSFREHAWEVLRTVKPGETVTYSEYALRSGNAAAFRAAASACAMNAAALFVPCHRVLRTDGSLGGFRYGLGIKENLLKRES